MLSNNEKTNYIKTEGSTHSGKLTKLETNNNTNLQKLNLKSLDDTSNNNIDIEIAKKNKGQPKNVIISNDIHVIQVESWKKYNSQQNMEPNLNIINNETSNENDNKKTKRDQKNDTKCSCLII